MTRAFFVEVVESLVGFLPLEQSGFSHRVSGRNGRASPWRRASETWADADLDDPGTAVEAADRLAAYIAALEPLRTGR